jgi:serine/threonine-protein kinase
MTGAAPQIGAYEILFELGHGGMGAVYLARAIGAPAGVGGFERLVAIKRLHLHLTGRTDSVQRFLDEAKVAARIHHANVVGIHQVGSDEAGHFLVQDYVEGDTLQGLVDHATLKRQRLPPPIVLRIALDALAGLHAVHEAKDAEGRPLGILHRDISTQNLLVGRDGVTRIADFGIAKHALSSVVTDNQYLQGRVLYMPPEYLARAPNVDRRFDVYGIGVTMFLALTGNEPWPGASEAQIVHQATTVGVPRLSATGLAIAPAVEAIVARAYDRDPEARYPNALAMLEAIEELGRHTGWIASHVEVAALVEKLVGLELAARRAAIMRARGSEASGTPEPLSVTSRGQARARSEPGSSRRVVVIASFLGGGALALGAAAMFARAPRGGPQVAAATSEAPHAAPVPATSANPPATSAPSANAASASAPSASAATGAASVSPPQAHAAARPHAEPHAAPAPAAPPPAAPPPAAPPPAAAPTGISTANPYR